MFTVLATSCPTTEQNHVIYPESWPLHELTVPDSCIRAKWPYNKTQGNYDGYTYTMESIILHRYILGFSYDGDKKDLIRHIEECLVEEDFIQVYDDAMNEESTSVIWHKVEENAETYIFLTNLTSISPTLYTLGIDLSKKLVIED